VPESWPGFTIEYRHGRTQYTIQVEQTDHGSTGQVITLDGRALAGPGIPLVDDGVRHTILVTLPRAHAD
jgi:cyclic beta-1,2-glucan synthetase